jgi:zinc/manganese transport system ATP-binding protein
VPATEPTDPAEPRSAVHLDRVTAVLGGRTVLDMLDVVADVVRPTAGRVTGLPSDGVAYVTQSVPPTTLPLTVRAAVTMGRWRHRSWWRPLGRADRAIVDAQLERMAITDLADRPVEELSGGQRQRTLVALGLAQRAGVLLVDEPTAGVDAESAALVVAALADEAAAGVVVVHAAHDPVAIAAADRIVALT